MRIALLLVLLLVVGLELATAFDDGNEHENDDDCVGGGQPRCAVSLTQSTPTPH